MKRKPVLFIVTNNHFDPTWRRCFNRRFVYRGNRFASYADIEDYYITDNLSIARRHPEYKFEVESPLVLRKYLERHPETRPLLRRLAKERRFAVTGAGDNIIDVNMVLGESIVRNYLLGLLWVEDQLGVKTRLGIRNDAFGNSAQLPQILRGCELKWVTGFTYAELKKTYWRGLDGSVVCAAQIPKVSTGGGYSKYAPCPSCRGRGCRVCRYRGIRVHQRHAIPGSIDADRLRQAGCGYVFLGAEETLPNPDIIRWARTMGRRYDVRFAIEEDFEPYVREALDGLDHPPRHDVHPAQELNPAFTGVYVTRIRTKQNCRRQEYALMGAETLAVMARLSGSGYPRQELDRLWRKLLFTEFHDAITGTHIDPAHEEIQDLWREIDSGIDDIRRTSLAKLIRPSRNTVSVLNCTGGRMTEVVSVMMPGRFPNAVIRDETGKNLRVISVDPVEKGKTEVKFIAAVPAMVGRCYRVAGRSGRKRTLSLRRPVIENDRFSVTADEHGLVSIYDKKLRSMIGRTEGYRPGELVLERDEGSPWGTLFADRSRHSLAMGTPRLVAAEKGDGVQRLVFRFEPGDYPVFYGSNLKATIRVELYDSIERVNFDARVFWESYNIRLRIAMPVAIKGRHMYGIPYGMISRKPYKPVYTGCVGGGDWPAVNWAGVEGDRFSVALLNKGLPSYRIESGSGKGSLILLSVLRSPVIPGPLNEYSSYTMIDYDGMRDRGDHHFEYALAAYDGPFAGSNVAADAESYNAGMIAVPGRVRWPEAPSVQSDHVRLAAIKSSEKGNGLVLRLWEYRGRAGTVAVSLPPRVRAAFKTNLLERDAVPLEIRNRKVALSLRPWEIATVLLQPAFLFKRP